MSDVAGGDNQSLRARLIGSWQLVSYGVRSDDGRRHSGAGHD
jgi:hypothetical protein